MIERLRIVKRGTLVNPLVDYMIEYWMVNQPRPCPSKRTNATSTTRLDDKGPGTVCTVHGDDEFKHERDAAVHELLKYYAASRSCCHM